MGPEEEKETSPPLPAASQGVRWLLAGLILCAVVVPLLTASPAVQAAGSSPCPSDPTSTTASVTTVCADPTSSTAPAPTSSSPGSPTSTSSDSAPTASEPPTANSTPGGASSKTAPTSTTLPSPAEPASTQTPIRVTSPSIAVSGFAYEGLRTLDTPTGSVTVMVFTMSGASWASLSTEVGCSGAPLRMTGGSGSAPDGLTLRATSFSATVGGTAVTYTPSSPPADQPLPGGSGTLTSVSIDAADLTAPGLEVADTTVAPGQC